MADAISIWYKHKLFSLQSQIKLFAVPPLWIAGTKYGKQECDKTDRSNRCYTFYYYRVFKLQAGLEHVKLNQGYQ